MAKHDPSVLGTFVIELDDKTRMLRAYGGFDHPNIFAGFIFLGIFVYVKYLLASKRINKLNFKNQFIYFLILFLFFFSFLMSFSRAAFLLFLFYIFFLFFWSIFDKNRRELILKITFSFFLVFLVSFFVFNNFFLQRFSLSSRLENISNQERLSQIEEAGNIISNNFIFGVGVNNYTNELRLNDGKEKEAWNYQPIHNVYLLILAEIGVLGLVSFLFVFGYFFSVCLKRGLFFEFFLIFALSFLFLFDHWLWSLHFGIIFLFFIFALVQRRIDA
jgi:O-antigen ligase